MGIATDHIVQHRLAELIAALSGTPDVVARLALDEAGSGSARPEDPLGAVAGALVAIRRYDHAVLAGCST